MGMPKETLAVPGQEGVQGAGRRRTKFVERTSGGGAQMGLQLGEGLLDGVEIGAVGRQVAHAGAVRRDQPGDRGRLMDAEVVEDDDVALAQVRAEHLRHIGREDLAVGGTLDQKRGVDPVALQMTKLWKLPGWFSLETSIPKWYP